MWRFMVLSKLIDQQLKHERRGKDTFKEIHLKYLEPQKQQLNGDGEDFQFAASGWYVVTWSLLGSF